LWGWVVAWAGVPQLDFTNNFYAGRNLWPGKWAKDANKVKIVLDNYFKKLGIHYVLINGAPYSGIKQPEETLNWWREILSYCREKGYPVGVAVRRPQELDPTRIKTVDFKTFEKIYREFPDVIQMVFFSEDWSRPARFIEKDRIWCFDGPQKPYRAVPLTETEIGHPLVNTYTGLSKAMKLTWGKLFEEIYRIAPKVKILIFQPWLMPEITELIDEPYARNLIPCKKSFGYMDIQSYEDLVREGKICAWGVSLSSDGCPYPHFTPEYMKKILMEVVRKGIHTWQLVDNYYLNVFGDNSLPVEEQRQPTIPDIQLNDYGRVIREVSEWAHKNFQKIRKEWGKGKPVAILPYPNANSWGHTIFNMMRVVTWRKFVRGDGMPWHADDPFIMRILRFPEKGLLPDFQLYTPTYPGIVLRFFDPETFRYSTCITPYTKVAILVGPGNMNQFTVERLKKYCQKGGYVIQAVGAYIHDPATGKEMLEFEGGGWKEPPSPFARPKPSQIRRIFEDFAGFIPIGCEVTVNYFRVKVVNKTTPLVKFDYSAEYRGYGGNGFTRFYFLTGNPKKETVTVLSIYDRKGREYPLLIFHPIGRGGVYTVLSWGLTGMQVDWLNEFVRKWMNEIIEKFYKRGGKNGKEPESSLISGFDSFHSYLSNC